MIRSARNPIVLLLVGFCLGFSPLPARAAGLIGTSVTGKLMFAANPANYYDPANGYVPASGYLNSAGPTVTVAAPAVEFGFNDNVNLDTVNFSASQFTIEDVVETGPFDAPFTMTFTDSAFAGMTFVKATDFFPNGLTYSVSGTTLTVNWAGGTVTAGDDYTSTFTVKVVPEPSAWAAVAMGMGGLALVIRRKRRLTA